MAQVSGLPDYPFAVIPHPIAHNTPEVIRVKAEDALRQIVPILSER
ncbi:MAG TPA: hypothetical protein VHL09_12960 [Dehalococcoidia bacterium]|nr:hypothetical protein [Dehalococcoidia bacterium]